MARSFVLLAAIVAGIAFCLPVSQAARSLSQVPTITCPADIQQDATEQDPNLGAVVTFSATASDGITPVCDYVSGEL